MDRRNIQQCSLEEYLVHKEKVDKEEAEQEEEVVESDVDVDEFEGIDSEEALLAICASRQAGRHPCRIMAADVEREYF